MSRACTPSSSRRRAARPNSSPSGPPQCWPKTPHTPWRQRRKLVHTGIPVATSASMAASGELVADEGDGLQQDEVGRVVLEGARQQLDELAPRRAVDVAVDGEGEGHLVLAAGLLDGLAPDLDAAARDVHPVQRREVPGALGLHLGGQAPRVGRDDVAALLDVAAVHVAHDVGVVDQRPRAPERLVAARARRRAAGARARWRCLRRGSRSARPSAAPRRGGTPAPARGQRPGPTRPAARSCRPLSIRPGPASPLRG